MDEPILMTGGSGRLGTELQRLLPDIVAPSHADLDITVAASVERALSEGRPRLVVHAAAYTAVGDAETDREACWRVNVEGTRTIAAACRRHDLPLVHISTDYVFWGDEGGYAEDDPPGPVRNYYALTKLVAEEAARAVAEHLVIRTSFRGRTWPYPTAFDDLFTSQDYVDVIGPEIALAIDAFAAIPHDTLHIGTERKSAYELAKRRRPDVELTSKSSIPVGMPDDISLDTSRWHALKRKLQIQASDLPKRAEAARE